MFKCRQFETWLCRFVKDWGVKVFVMVGIIVQYNGHSDNIHDKILFKSRAVPGFGCCTAINEKGKHSIKEKTNFSNSCIYIRPQFVQLALEDLSKSRGYWL